MHKILLEITDWEFKGLNDYHKIHQLHPYFAKYHSELPRRIIQSMTKVNDVVLDPFCGSGTTLVESSLIGRNAIGIDMNPIACLMSNVKTSIISNSKATLIYKLLHDIESDIDSYYGKTQPTSRLNGDNNYKLPQFHNRDFWFTSNALNELAIIKRHILFQKDRVFLNLLLLSFSRIIVFASNQHGESRYTRILKKRKPKDIFNQFNKVVLNMFEVVKDYNKHRKDVEIKVYNKDSRTMDFIKDNSIDLVVTSPPYLNSWDYGLYHRFRFFWLDMNVKLYEENEIGKHLRALEGRSKTDEVYRYRIDMRAVLKEVSRTLKHNKFCFIVNANSIVKKKFIDTNEILVEEAKKCNLMLIDVLDRRVNGPHYGMHAALISKNIKVESKNFIDLKGTQKREQILIFKKK